MNQLYRQGGECSPLLAGVFRSMQHGFQPAHLQVRQRQQRSDHTERFPIHVFAGLEAVRHDDVLSCLSKHVGNSSLTPPFELQTFRIL